jgi:DNA-binding NarL/FixJ family response regulator
LPGASTVEVSYVLNAITVLVADDDPIIRESLAAILEGQADMEVVGEAADGQQAVELASNLRPTVVLTDIGMPRLDGIEATRLIKRAIPETAVIFLTVYSTHLMEALAAGASRYLLKDCPVDELLTAIRSCASGAFGSRSSSN